MTVTTDRNQIQAPVKYRNMWSQVGLMIVTFGFYAIYWFHQTAVEMAAVARDHRAEPALWTILLFIPLAGLYSHYKYAELYEAVSSGRMDRWLLWILWIVFPPAVWLIVQSDLNRRATYGAP